MAPIERPDFSPKSPESLEEKAFVVLLDKLLEKPDSPESDEIYGELSERIGIEKVDEEFVRELLEKKREEIIGNENAVGNMKKLAAIGDLEEELEAKKQRKMSA